MAKEGDPALTATVSAASPSGSTAGLEPLSEPTPSPGLQKGATIGRYVIQDVLGRGGMGIVYRAHDPELDRPIALKLVRAELLASGALGEGSLRLMREAQAMARLSHPNIIAVHDVGTSADQVFVAMELVEGGTLKGWLRAEKRSQEAILEVFRQAGAGLAAAHAAGLVHRDFKPDNVLCGHDSADSAPLGAGPVLRVRVVDFGLARPSRMEPGLEETQDSAEAGAPVEPSGGVLETPLTRVGAIIGTPAYMAPEQHVGDPIDGRTDQFSFCVALYQALYDAHPFHATSAAALAGKVLAGKVDEAPAGSAVPARLRRVLLRGLHLETERRYPSMQALLADLSLAPRGRSPWLLRLGLALGVCAGIAALFLALRAPRPTALPSAVVTPPAPRAAAPPARHRQITFVGDASSPALSADGRSMAYVSANIVTVLDVASGQSREAFRGGSIRNLRWSPDGSQLLLLSGATFAKAFIVPRLGGATQQLPFKASYACWSPDGSELAYTVLSERKIHIVPRGAGPGREIPVAGAYTWLTDLDWSKPGGLVYLTSDPKLTALFAVRPDGSGARKLFEDPDADVFSPRFTPRGEGVYLVVIRQRTGELVKIPLGGGPPVSVMAGIELGRVLSVSGDGRRLSYTREAGHSNLWQLTLGKTARTQRLTTGTTRKSDVAVSPDRKHLAFSMADGDGAELYLMPIEGGAARRLTFLGGQSKGAVFSPDGARIAFAMIKDGSRPKLMTVEVATGRVLEVEARDMGDDFSLAWAPGSHLLVHRNGNRNFGVLDPATGKERALVRDESVGWIFNPAPSPDGGRVAVTWNRKPYGLWLVNLADGAERLLSAGRLFAVGWSADGKWIHALRESEDAVTEALVTVPSSGGAPRVLLSPLPFGDRLLGLSSVDDRRMIAVVDEPQAEAWIAEGFDPDSP